VQTLMLGTAQWGLDYGTTNTSGRLNSEVIGGILAMARGAGLAALDTAPGYGDSEARVGEFGVDFAVQTKVSAAGGDAAHIRASVSASLDRLGRDRISSLLVHDWTLLSSPERSATAQVLADLRVSGVVDRVGVSGYSSSDISSALATFEVLDVVQVPVSVLDQRLEGSTAVGTLRARGGRVQARSVLLQGAAVAPEAHPLFGTHPDVVRLRSSGQSLALCLGYVASRTWVDEVLLAPTSGDELAASLASWASPLEGVSWADWASIDPWLLDPRLWTASTQVSRP
jgi:aryl-alcohol dehydrogenase-like predicted oxidoreductase